MTTPVAAGDGSPNSVEVLKHAAAEALAAWDADKDSRVGKLLASMAGRLPGYRADIDKALGEAAARSPRPTQNAAGLTSSCPDGHGLMTYHPDDGTPGGEYWECPVCRGQCMWPDARSPREPLSPQWAPGIDHLLSVNAALHAVQSAWRIDLQQGQAVAVPTPDVHSEFVAVAPREPLEPISACEDCGLPYEQFPLDVVLPDADWLLIHPSGDGGLLCAGCIATRASRLATTIILSARIVNAADHDTYSSLKNATWASLAAARSALPSPELEALSVADTQSLLGADRPISIGKVPTDPIGMRALAAIVRHRVRFSQEPPAFWRCTACGCLWRDNRVFHDESVSLSSAKQISCPECEMKPTAEVCEPLFRQPNVAALPQLDDGGVAETERRHAADCRDQEAQRQREADALQAGFEAARSALPPPQSKD